ncbi:phosphate/phosphite/phosphonate ABC transporter substrate-binding protein [Erwiniaceae bacterium BAC15a-03b]|uniref:Phosphate/phosphite/phosphonate ABC transporter substrate-binding protein n=1 Tax=Winslowiella arboricola TaxID=2978220 RepID=A0A9J6PGI2_9GAMM|nr:PhnD/SsuA/transferrin family substrate-binding protein [Winslowiella arboricola]MCU5771188.1 phosphate/phosphite/phosphonate ABC transporter substrate-binding protein [Winslowiella arboricola]MCU5776474.1 phosphate/phosphite/phosphonate ABC transporter substrate-binding protein [Winslowiella arboricola]
MTATAAVNWKKLLQEVFRRADINGEVIDYPAPAPLEALWQRADLAGVFMCGLPFSLGLFPVVALATPVPLHSLADGAGSYRSRLIVAKDAPYQHLTETFGQRLAFTNPESHSGYSALRFHLLRWLAPGQQRLYRETVGPLITPRRVVETIAKGLADIGPVDSYAFELLARDEPELMQQVRVIDQTEPAPMPLLVASATLDPMAVAKLQRAFIELQHDSSVSELLAALQLQGFIAPPADDYQLLAQRAAAAQQAGYGVLQ